MAPLLQNFPTEILESIFGNLCIHCDHLGAACIPDLDTVCGRENKQSLARLCQMSRSLCSVAQPILFHYFTMNNTAAVRNPKARLFKFMRGLSLRPDLTYVVRAIELLPPPDWNDAYPVDHPTWDALRQRHPSSEIGNTGNQLVLPLGHIAPSLINLAPNLEYLRLMAPSLDKFEGWCDLEPLSRMRVLEVVSPCDQHFRMVDLPNVFRVLPNLEVFRGSSSMRLSCTHHFSGQNMHAYAPNLCEHKPWEIVPPTVTKAIVGHVDIFRLSTLLDNCPQLEDLEMFLVPGTYDWENNMPQDGALVSARGSLRRLVVTMHDWLGWTRFPGMFEKKTTPAGIYGQANMAFRKMDVLEDLAVDQCLLHADVVHATGGEAVDRLSLALPESLKSLHVGYVVSWKHLQPQLRDLATRRKAGYFENLTTIRVDPYVQISNADLAAERNFLAESGIDFIIGTNQPIRSGQSQQMLTPSPGSRYNE